jgi:hypothetical protein
MSSLQDIETDNPITRGGWIKYDDVIKPVFWDSRQHVRD